MWKCCWRYSVGGFHMDFGFYLYSSANNAMLIVTNMFWCVEYLQLSLESHTQVISPHEQSPWLRNLIARNTERVVICFGHVFTGRESGARICRLKLLGGARSEETWRNKQLVSCSMKIIDLASCDCSVREARFLKPDYTAYGDICMSMRLQDVFLGIVPITKIGRDGLWRKHHSCKVWSFSVQFWWKYNEDGDHVFFRDFCIQYPRQSSEHSI